MRVIERKMWQAIDATRDWQSGNTLVTIGQHATKAYVFLHGNCLGYYSYITKRFVVDPVTVATWPTPTTKSRLRALGVDVYTKNHVLYLEGVALN